MSRLTLQAVLPGEGEPTACELPLDRQTPRCRLHLRTVPGSHGLQLLCARDGQSRWRFEVAADGDERIAVELELGEDGELHAGSENRHVYTLPADRRFAPLPLVRHQLGRRHLELILVVDGTARRVDGGASSLLLGSEPWAMVVEQLVAIVAALGAGRIARLGVLAFGDHAFPMLDAPDLLPSYLLWPAEAERGELPWLRAGDLQARLLALPSSTGGDCVDALADALAACARLPPHATARRVLVVCGDSPGHSLLAPAPDGADLLPRAQEIEGPVLRLHAMGALLVTIFNDADVESVPDWAPHREVPEHARRQYVQLASTPAHAFLLSSLDPRRVAKAILRPPKLRGRGPSYGALEQIEPLPARDVTAVPVEPALDVSP